MSIVVFGEDCDAVLAKAKAKVRQAEKVLSDAQWALIEHNIKMEARCKEMGIEPITLYANKFWPTDRLYVMSQEGRDFISRYNYESPGVAYDMLYSIVQHPDMFIVIELTTEYVEYLETLKDLEEQTTIDDKEENIPMKKFLFKYQIRCLSTTNLLVEAATKKDAVDLFFAKVAGCFYDEGGSVTLIDVIDLSTVKAITKVNI